MPKGDHVVSAVEKENLIRQVLDQLRLARRGLSLLIDDAWYDEDKRGFSDLTTAHGLADHAITKLEVRFPQFAQTLNDKTHGGGRH